MISNVPEPRWPGGNVQRERPSDVVKLDQLYVKNNEPVPAPENINDRLSEPRWVGGARNDVSTGYMPEKNVEKCYEIYSARNARKSAAKLMEEATPADSERRGGTRWPNGNRLDVYDGQPQKIVEPLMTDDDILTKPRPGSSRRGAERGLGGASPDRLKGKGPKLTPLWTKNDELPADPMRLPSRRGDPRWVAGARTDLQRGLVKPEKLF